MGRLDGTAEEGGLPRGERALLGSAGGTGFSAMGKLAGGAHPGMAVVPDGAFLENDVRVSIHCAHAGGVDGMSPNKSKVVVVMPAYNAAKTLHMTYADLPRDMVDLVILVDDGSSDETAKIARQLGLELFRALRVWKRSSSNGLALSAFLPRQY